MVFVGGVVVNSLCSIAAGRIESDLVFAICDLTAASLLIDRAEDVEKLADAFEFGITGFWVKATRTNRDAEERSPGSPRAPMPRL